MSVLKINEIFKSIQGESTHAGRQCIFIRLTGCNLRCSYCDTKYSYNQGKNYSIVQLLEKIKKYNCKLVEITGGEPLIQKEVISLAKKLVKCGYEVLIETNGSQDISVLDPKVIKIIDFKCPSSGESKKMLWSNIKHLTEKDEVKFVIGSRKDYLWARNIVKTMLGKKQIVLFSVVFGKVLPKDLAKWILKDAISNVRLQIQLHKIIWSQTKRGV